MINEHRLSATIDAQNVVLGSARDRIGFPNHWACWMERIEGGMRDEVARIAQGHASDLDALDHHILTMADVMARWRASCAAIVELRNGRKSP